MENKQEMPEVTVNIQYIKDMSLEVPHAPQIFAKLTKQPQMNIDLNIDVQNLGSDQYEVTLNTRLNADIDNEKLFIFELSYGTACTLKMSEAQKEPILYIEIPKLIFPYVRQIISSNLANAGLPALMLSPVDFAGIYRQKKSQSETSKD